MHTLQETRSVTEVISAFRFLTLAFSSKVVILLANFDRRMVVGIPSTIRSVKRVTRNLRLLRHFANRLSKLDSRSRPFMRTKKVIKAFKSWQLVQWKHCGCARVAMIMIKVRARWQLRIRVMVRTDRKNTLFKT